MSEATLPESAKTPRKEIHVVTGGGGYPGFCLAKKLAQDGHHVRLLDLRHPVWDLEEGMEFIKGSICEEDVLSDVIAGASVVYHMASFGMSGREMLNRKVIEKVNIGGSELVLKACRKHDVTRLVYTSTINVVFVGKTIIEGDETLPYPAEKEFVDEYSRTKMLAEKKILAANGSKTANGSILRCCVLRLGGVYGPGEQRHLPRIVEYLEKGIFVWTVGPKESKVDFLHVDNLVQAHCLAGKALAAERDFVAAGKAYFITDDKPINNFVFFRPLIEGLGYRYPTINLPFKLIIMCALIIQNVHKLVRPIYDFQPILTVGEVVKVSIMHYFTIKNAKQDLGYAPTVQNDMSQVITYYRKLGRINGNYRSRFTRYLVNIITILVIYCVIMYLLPQVTGLELW